MLWTRLSTMGFHLPPFADRGVSLGLKLGPVLWLVWVGGQQVIGLPFLADNRLLCAIRPGNRPRFDDPDRNNSPDVLVHGATLLEGRAG